jgi:hypothetical protein
MSMAESSLPPPAPSWKALAWVLLPLLIVGGVLGGLVGLGRWARGLLRPQAPYRVALAEVDCQPPAGLARADFLREVQELAGLPGEFSLLDPDLPRRLAQAFGRHPWVESARVELGAGRRVQVRPVYRTPLLAVAVGGARRAVDGHGVLLPATAATDGLPFFCPPVSSPQGPPGTAWGDPGLMAAARTLAFLHAQAEGPRFVLVESAVTGLVLTTAGGSRVRWGQPADDEPGHREAATRKGERLRQHCRDHGDLEHPDGPREYDLRPLDQAPGPD